MRKYKSLFFIFFLSIALFNLIYIIYFISNIAESGLVDMNRYWNCGHYIFQGKNPYHAHLNKIELFLPIRLIDGSYLDSDLASELLHLPGFPGNTAPFVFLFAIFSFLPLKYAAIIWSSLNILFAVFIPLIIIKIFENYGLSIPKYFSIFSILVFFSLNMTFRGVIGNGQTTNLIFLLLCLSLLFVNRAHPIYAGLLFGFALSKYNVAIPVFIYLLIRKEWKVILVAALVQITGILLLSFTSQVSVLEIIQDYLEIAYFHATISYVHGINISAYFPKSLMISIGLFAILSFLFGLGLYFAIKRSEIRNGSTFNLDLSILGLLFLWTLLSLYHLGYDTVLVIFPILHIFLYLDEIEHPLKNQRWMVIDSLIVAIVLILLVLPGSVYRFILPGKNLDTFAMTAAIFLLSIVSFGVLYQYKSSFNLKLEKR